MGPCASCGQRSSWCNASLSLLSPGSPSAWGQAWEEALHTWPLYPQQSFQSPIDSNTEALHRNGSWEESERTQRVLGSLSGSEEVSFQRSSDENLLKGPTLRLEENKVL